MKPMLHKLDFRSFGFVPIGNVLFWRAFDRSKAWSVYEDLFPALAGSLQCVAIPRSSTPDALRALPLVHYFPKKGQSKCSARRAAAKLCVKVL